jgi:hypothetical protein
MGCAVGKEKEVAENPAKNRKERPGDDDQPQNGPVHQQPPPHNREHPRPNPLAPVPPHPDAEDERAKQQLLSSTSKLMLFYDAGAYQAGDPTIGIPLKGPYPSERVPPQTGLSGTMLFSANELLPRVVPLSSPLFSQVSAGPPSLSPYDCWFCRAYFPHTLIGYSCGWARVDITPRAPHFNLRKHGKDDLEKLEKGIALDLSKRKKWFLYSEAVTAIGLYISVNGKDYSTSAAASSDTWGCEPISGAFFTFVPDPGSILGENSLAVTLKVSMKERDGKDCTNQTAELREKGRKDPRWVRMTYEMNKILLAIAEKRLSADEPQTCHVTIRYGIRFRYNNQKFTAWSERDAAKGNFRFVDDNREASAISSEVASGAILVDLADGEVDPGKIAQALKATIDRLTEDQGLLQAANAHRNTEDMSSAVL